jgi:multiple antibiotic resistance protein
VDVPAAVVTLLLIMDPVGNIPPFLSILKTVPVERRRIVLVREILFAYVVLLVFLFLGNYLLRFRRLEQEALSSAGGIVRFLIALRMVFPREGGIAGEPLEGEPFLVPLAIPLFAGPSTLAALLLLQQSSPGDNTSLLIAVTIAWAIGGAILLSSTFFYRVLRERGLIAIERLMGMLLVMVSVQMLVYGL